MNRKLLLLGTALVTASKNLLRHVLFLVALLAAILPGTVLAVGGIDINVSNPSFPPTPVGNVGWNPGMTHARAIHWAWNGSDWYQFWGSCPDDSGGCSGFAVNSPQYQADFDIDGSQTPCHPNTGELTNLPGSPFNSLPCPLYADWYGNWGKSGSRAYSQGINNYPWNKWNSPNIWIGIQESRDRSPTLQGRRLDNAFLSLTLNAYLHRTYVQDGIAPRGQGRILIGFTFTGANGVTYVIEMNFSNMRVNLNDGRHTSDYPAGAPMISVSNPWRDDLWAEYIPGSGSFRTYVIGARNWGYNLVEGQPQTIFFDPWWVATTLLYPPSSCPQPLNNDGTPGTSNFDPGGYGVVPCGEQASFALPYAALFDANGQPAAILGGFYCGVEMGGSAVLGSANITRWTIKKRW